MQSFALKSSITVNSGCRYLITQWQGFVLAKSKLWLQILFYIINLTCFSELEKKFHGLGSELTECRMGHTTTLYTCHVNLRGNGTW
jgi:hypothetical protein